MTAPTPTLAQLEEIFCALSVQRRLADDRCDADAYDVLTERIDQILGMRADAMVQQP